MALHTAEVFSQLKPVPEFPTALERQQQSLAAINAIQGTQSNALQLKNQQQQMADAEKLRVVGDQIHQAIMTHGGDLEAALPDIAKVAPPELYLHFQKAVDDYKAAALTQKKTGLDIDETTQKLAFGKTAEERAVEAAKNTSLKAQFDLNQAQRLAAEPKKLDEFYNKEGKRVISLQQPDGTITYEVGPEAGAAPRAQVPGTDIPLPPSVEQQRIRITAAGKAPTEGSSITPESLDILATQFAKTGTLPPMGNGAAAANDRKAIFNRAAVLYPAVDLATSKTDFEANKKSLDGLQKQADAVQAFEATALKNMTPLLSSAKKVIDSGSPFINMPLREAAARLAGSPDQAVFNAALQIVTTEYAKIITNPSLSGQLSDSARHEVEALLPANATLKQVVAVTDLLKTDSGNRRTALDDQIREIKGRIKAAGGNAAPAAGKAMTPALIQSNMRANPGATRKQVIDFLTTQGYQEQP